MIDGFIQVYRTEGWQKLFGGGATASFRAGVMAVGQLTSYDQLKKMCLGTGFFHDDLFTHFTCSMGAVSHSFSSPSLVIGVTRY